MGIRNMVLSLNTKRHILTVISSYSVQESIIIISLLPCYVETGSVSQTLRFQTYFTKKKSPVWRPSPSVCPVTYCRRINYLPDFHEILQRCYLKQVVERARVWWISPHLHTYWHTYYTLGHKCISAFNSHNSWPLWVKLCVEYRNVISVNSCGFWENKYGYRQLYVRAWMQFCQYFINSSHFYNIRYRTSPRNAPWCLWASWIWLQCKI